MQGTKKTESDERSPFHGTLGPRVRRSASSPLKAVHSAEQLHTPAELHPQATPHVQVGVQAQFVPQVQAVSFVLLVMVSTSWEEEVVCQ